MSDVQRYLMLVDNDKLKATEVAQGTAHRIQTQELKLLDVVQSLGEYLTDDDATIRARSVAYFAAVLGALDPKYLSKQQISVTVQFFCDRIQDATGLREAAEGLAAVQSSFRFSSEHAIQIATALFTGAQDLQQHPQSSRFIVLRLLDSILSGQRNALKSMGEDFIVGITDLVSGEKDPRNLMIIFSMLKAVMVEWDIAKHVEALFDSVFCYYPITFRPPPDDPYGITAQDLKQRLRDCIASSSYFAAHAYPALLDKLDSTSPNVKKDVLQTITACSLSYDPAVVSHNSTQLWDALKFEVLNAQEEDLAEETLKALRAIASTLSLQAPTAAQPYLSHYLTPIIKECNEQLQEPQQKQAKPAGQILGAISTASPAAFDIIVKSALPPLFTMYQDVGVVGKQRALIEVINRLLESSLEVFGDWASTAPRPEIDQPLDAFRDRLFELLSQALMGAAKTEVSFRITALKGLLLTTRMRDFLAEDEIGMVVQFLDEIILLEDTQGRDELKNEAIQALVIISRTRSNLITDITFPAFMSKLPDTDNGAENAQLATLEGLARLGVEDSVVDLLIRRLLSKLDIILTSDSSPAYSHALLSTILYVVSQRESKEDANLDAYYQRLVPDLIRKAILPLHTAADLSSLNDEAALDIVGRLANVVIRSANESRQLDVSSNIYQLFEPQFKPVLDLDTATFEHRRSMILSTYLLAGLKQGMIISSAVGQRLSQLVHQFLTQDLEPLTRLAYLRQIALIVNKVLGPGDSQLITTIADGIFEQLKSPDTQSKQTNQHVAAPAAFRVLFWITKALLLRTDVQFIALVNQLIDLLSHPTLGTLTARGFVILLAPDSLLSKANHAIVRLLHKQKLFAHCVPLLADKFRAADSSIKPNYLVALSGIIGLVPSDIILPHLDTMLPLLMQSIDLQDAEVKAATIQTLTITMKESPGAVEGHVASLIARLLSSASSAKDPSNPPKVRLAALQCLGMFPSVFRQELLVPYKMQVTRRLMATLDDAKRSVRKEAVDCRATWFRMDEPSEDL
ncbi:MAG: hypothetical protein M1825_002288 [Sarcosagium campestre]|nr:MAG: hypothetical protein M1825_002288 [Sarcosagium campestre]